MNAGGKLIMECLLETNASTMVEFIQGLQGTLSLTFEEGTSVPGCTICCNRTFADGWFMIQERTLF